MHLNLSTLDLAILMYNVYRSAHELGYADADTSLDELIYSENPRIRIKHSTLEKFLYCANMLDEKGKFWHPYNKSFDGFMAKQPRWPKFDRVHNYFIVEDTDG